MEYVEQHFGRRAIEWVGASQGIYSIVRDRQTVYGNNPLQVVNLKTNIQVGRHSREVDTLGSTRILVARAHVAA